MVLHSKFSASIAVERVILLHRTKENTKGNSAFSRFFSLVWILRIHVCVLFILGAASSVLAVESHTEALARYYVETASEVFHKQDIRFADSSFGMTVIVRRYSLAPDLDTLQLDTAIVRVFFSSDVSSRSDSLAPDSVIVLRSSFVTDAPTLPIHFTKPSWEGEFVYSLFPNDPGTGDISISYDSLSAGGGLSQLGSSGILTVDRATGALRYSTLLIRSKNSNTRYSRETSYEAIMGYAIPVKIVEQFSEIGFWENRYEIRETVFLNLKFFGER